MTTTVKSDWQEDLSSSFQSMDEHFPIRVVEAGGDVTPLARVDRTIPAYEFRGETRELSSFIERTHVSGLIVLQRGDIVFESYRQGADEETLFTSWSVAKSVTATLVGLAEQDGLIDSLNDPVKKYLPEPSDSPYGDVSIHHVLQMSSGVVFDETYEEPNSDFWVFMNEFAGKGRVNDYLLTVEAGAPPGSKYNYNTSETQLLGWLVRRVTGSSVSEYLSKKLWRPVGMEADAYWLLDADDGMEITGIGLNARLRDYARFGQMYITGKGLPSGWVAAATVPSDPQVQHGKLYEGIDLGYQYQWWSFPDQSFEAQGIHGQFIYVNPQTEIVVVVASAWPEPWVFDHELEFYALIESLNKNL